MKSDKPVSGMSKPVASSTENDEANQNLREAREEQKDQAAIDSKNLAAANKVATMLGATYYVTDYTWPFLRANERQMSVTEFYPELNIAIDKFYHYGTNEEAITKEKKRLLNANGVRYAFLDPSKSLASIGPDLDEQEAIEKHETK